MALVARSTDDILIDRMKAALQVFEAEQVALDPLVFFTVRRDLLRPTVMRDMPLVNIWCESLDSVREGSSSRLTGQESARINVDCYAKGFDADEENCSDIVAITRLNYLKQQVKEGLYRLINSDFGFPVGTIGKKKWPSWKLFQNDLKLPETEVVAGRWTIEVEYSWTPEDIEGSVLDRIEIDAGIWAGSYTY